MYLISMASCIILSIHIFTCCKALAVAHFVALSYTARLLYITVLISVAAAISYAKYVDDLLDLGKYIG